MQNKAFSKILVLVIPIILISVGYFGWQYFGEQEEVKIIEQVSKDETADWETYKNQQMGFTVKHPKVWLWQPTNLHNEQVNRLAIRLNTWKDGFCQTVFMRSTPFVDTGEEIPYKDLIAREKQRVVQIGINNPETSIEELVEEKIMIDKVQATKLSYSSIFTEIPHIGSEISVIFIPLEGNETFQIAYNAQLDNHDDCQLEFNKILSTFKFLE